MASSFFVLYILRFKLFGDLSKPQKITWFWPQTFENIFFTENRSQTQLFKIFSLAHLPDSSTARLRTTSILFPTSTRQWFLSRSSACSRDSSSSARSKLDLSITEYTTASASGGWAGVISDWGEVTRGSEVTVAGGRRWRVDLFAFLTPFSKLYFRNLIP